MRYHQSCVRSLLALDSEKARWKMVSARHNVFVQGRIHARRDVAGLDDSDYNIGHYSAVSFAAGLPWCLTMRRAHVLSSCFVRATSEDVPHGCCSAHHPASHSLGHIVPKKKIQCHIHCFYESKLAVDT